MYTDPKDRPLEWGNPPESEQVPLGWRCPLCKRGLAPHVSECSCVPDECT
ncbi:hypothetical protein LCGC14_2635960, partial [marine sediment metagenome]